MPSLSLLHLPWGAAAGNRHHCIRRQKHVRGHAGAAAVGHHRQAWQQILLDARTWPGCGWAPGLAKKTYGRKNKGKTYGGNQERREKKKIKKEKQEALKSFYSSCLSDEVVSPNNFSKTTKFHRKSCL
jgi:hypothetical protein